MPATATFDIFSMRSIPGSAHLFLMANITLLAFASVCTVFMCCFNFVFSAREPMLR